MFEYGSVEEKGKGFPWGMVVGIVAFVGLLVGGYFWVT